MLHSLLEHALELLIIFDPLFNEVHPKIITIMYNTDAWKIHLNYIFKGKAYFVLTF